MFSGNNFGSAIQTGSPFRPADLRASLQAPNPYSSGQDRSRSAFARGLLDSQGAGIRQQYEDYGREFQTKAERARSADVFSQRQDQVARYGLERDKKAEVFQQDKRREQALKDFRAYLRNMRKDTRINTMGNVVNAISDVALMVGGFAMMGPVGGAGGAAVAASTSPSMGMQALGAGTALTGLRGLTGSIRTSAAPSINRNYF